MVQPKNRIRPTNLHYNSEHPNPKYPIIGSMALRGTLVISAVPRSHTLDAGLRWSGEYSYHPRGAQQRRIHRSEQVLGWRGLGFRTSEFRVLGFRDLGSSGFSFLDLGIKVLGLLESDPMQAEVESSGLNMTMPKSLHAGIDFGAPEISSSVVS